MKDIKYVILQVLRLFLLCIIVFSSITFDATGQEQKIRPSMQYTLSMPDPSNHLYHIDLESKGWAEDTINVKMPQWMPGYYQIMDYSKEVINISAKNSKAELIPVIKIKSNEWRIIPGKNNSFSISYDINADRKFVANNYLDSTHGYIVPAATFMYLNDKINTPVSLKILNFKKWNRIATGLEPVAGKVNEFTAPDFDILYDCPVLVGNLEELPSFEIKGVPHRFIAYNPGSFNRENFIARLDKAVNAAVTLIGDIPYKQYTFIGIGPGFGGIEHLNNTTVSFNGNGLDSPEAMSRMLKFLIHEYFHNYNVKRIRPYELGPFNYESENKTNLLWVSEGLSVYYEYIILKKAGLISEEDLFKSLENNINTFENDPGRHFQSLSQASYNTWSDGPFGNKSESADRAISYYEKGPLIGMILDFKIRSATQNQKSLDDVMRFLYGQYYKKLQRGFTDAEFQNACEDAAGISLSSEFEYVYTTKKLDYSTFLYYAGLKISEVTEKNTGKRKFIISKEGNMNSSQQKFFHSWSGG